MAQTPEATNAQIVGAGPACLASACELARHSVAAGIIDQLVKSSKKSNALVIHARIVGSAQICWYFVLISLATINCFFTVLPSFSQTTQQVVTRPGDVLKEGRKLIDQRRYEEAVARFKQYCLMRPQESNGYFWSGITYDEMGNYSASEKSYRDALVRAENEGMDSAEIRTNLGNALLKQKKIDEAIEEYKRANEVDPLCALAKLNLGRAYIEKGDGASALSAIDKCADLHFKGLHVKYYRAKALLLLGRKDEAASLAKQLIMDLPEGSFKNDVRQEFSGII
ncbi:MAG: tetratricopeptide repeat protein [Candidatus Obscuribacterales bacterium]|nr:tetratricopeptide repeat protein [Candidatus Obscuribacterales bacterium]